MPPSTIYTLLLYSSLSSLKWSPQSVFRWWYHIRKSCGLVGLSTLLVWLLLSPICPSVEHLCLYYGWHRVQLWARGSLSSHYYAMISLYLKVIPKMG